MTVTDERLRALVQRAVTSSGALFQLLVEGLDWPVPDGLRLGDVELDWDPSELHLDPDKIARLRSIKQIPPLTAKQDFGVFVLDFEGGRLPIGAIRRLVDRLVRRKRSRTGAGQHPVWELEDLLFFCFSGTDSKSLHVVGFREVEGKRVLRVLSWGEGTTETRLDLVVRRGIPDLVWAGAGPAITLENAGAGFHGYREGIRSAAALSTRMAEVAQDVRDEVAALYDVETEDGPIRGLYREIHEELLGDLTPERFADVYAQTMVYGLLTARIAHPDRFQADQAITALSFDNPFLDAIYSRFRQQSEDVVDVDELGLRELAEELAVTDVDEILADFGATQRKDDPVVFFYEEFLQKYDLKQRKDLGAFYTPLPVVRYIVRTVDEVLKRDFGLPLGVADGTTWRNWADQAAERAVPEGVDPDQPVARMIDPANGTGTFFVEWLRQVKENGGGGAVETALDRMDALEISLASYAVAHLKVSLGLPPGLRERLRLPIYLGDTLGVARPHVFDEMADPVSAEGAHADRVKFERAHNVVIGNPPYDRVESFGTGGLVTEPSADGRSLFDDILDPARANTNFAHHASLYNQYIYFWRWAIWQAFERQEGPAVVCLITASSWLTGPGFIGLRQLVRRVADDVLVLDLGGENKGGRKDENVFEIGTPVSIVTVLRRGASDASKPASALYRRLTGTRADKLRQLDPGRLPGELGWQQAPDGWFDPLAPPTGAASWGDFPSLIDLLPWQQPGCKFNRTWPIAPVPSVLRDRWSRFLSSADLKDRERCFVMTSSGRNIYTAVRGMRRLCDLGIGEAPQPIVRYAFRSFDNQWAFSDPRLAKTESPSLWESVSARQLFLTTATTEPLGEGPAATVTSAVPDLHYFAGRGGKDIIPLYRDSSGTPNASPELLARVTSAHRTINAAVPTVTAERLFAYVYGIMAGADYTARFAVELETPGPRVPLTADPDLFELVVGHGEQLLWLHTYGERFRGASRTTLPVFSTIAWRSPVTKIPHDLRDVSYDPQACELRVSDGVLAGVTPSVWEFAVSGMQVVRKWLGYRTAKGTGRSASSTSPLDAIRPTNWSEGWSQELRDLVVVLTRTLELLPRGSELLDRVCAGPLIPASDLPPVPAALRLPPRTAAAGQAELGED